MLLVFDSRRTRLICDISYLQAAIWASFFAGFLGGDKPQGVFCMLDRVRLGRRAVFAAGFAAGFTLVFAGIRVAPSRRGRCPCAGRHLLFFAAAKKSRQKKAAHTASPCVCLRALNGPVLSAASPFSMHAANASNERITCFTHPRRSMRNQTVNVLWRQTVCRLSRHMRSTPD